MTHLGHDGGLDRSSNSGCRQFASGSKEEGKMRSFAIAAGNGKLGTMVRMVAMTGIATGLMEMGGTAFAAPNNPLIAWQGAITITGLTSQCKNQSVGDVNISIYRPNLDPAEPVTGLSFIGGRGQQTYYYKSGAGKQMHGNGNWVGTTTTGRVTTGNGSNTGKYTLKIKPAVVTAATDVITIDGKFTNAQNTIGCTLQFKGAYRQRPN